MKPSLKVKIKDNLYVIFEFPENTSQDKTLSAALIKPYIYIPPLFKKFVRLEKIRPFIPSMVTPTQMSDIFISPVAIVAEIKNSIKGAKDTEKGFGFFETPSVEVSSIIASIDTAIKAKGKYCYSPEILYSNFQIRIQGSLAQSTETVNQINDIIMEYYEDKRHMLELLEIQPKALQGETRVIFINMLTQTEIGLQMLSEDLAMPVVKILFWGKN